MMVTNDLMPARLALYQGFKLLDAGCPVSGDLIDAVLPLAAAEQPKLWAPIEQPQHGVPWEFLLRVKNPVALVSWARVFILRAGAMTALLRMVGFDRRIRYEWTLGTVVVSHLYERRGMSHELLDEVNALGVFESADAANNLAENLVPIQVFSEPAMGSLMAAAIRVSSKEVKKSWLPSLLDVAVAQLDAALEAPTRTDHWLRLAAEAVGGCASRMRRGRCKGFESLMRVIENEDLSTGVRLHAADQFYLIVILSSENWRAARPFLMRLTKMPLAKRLNWLTHALWLTEV